MKRAFLFCGILIAGGMSNVRCEVITLDLTKSSTLLEFNQANGSWTGTYDDDAESIESQVFSFFHGSVADWNTWWGFTASNHADNARPENTLIQQWSNMAKGGIVLDEDGTILTDAFGAPVTSSEVPYLVAYYGSFMSARPVDVTFNTGKTYNAVGAFVNLNSYPYYSIEYGDSFARAFTNNDSFTLTIHGVAPDETESTVEVVLASYSNGNLSINRGWRYVDLSGLGEIKEIYFTLDSTDSGAYGMNTPGYFCLDKLMVSPVEGSYVTSLSPDRKGNITYDKSTRTVTLRDADFAIVYDMEGRKVMSVESDNFSLSTLPAGVYLIKAGNDSLKITR